MKKIMVFSVLLLSLCHFFSKQSINGSDKPLTNVQGIIIDGSGNNVQAINITLGGSFERITFYVSPHASTQLPEHRVYMDLKNIKTIAVIADVNNEARIHTFGNRKYVAVVVSNRDTIPTMNTYIIEKDKMVRFDTKGSNELISHEIPIHAIDKIIMEKSSPRYVTA